MKIGLGCRFATSRRYGNCNEVWVWGPSIRKPSHRALRYLLDRQLEPWTFPIITFEMWKMIEGQSQVAVGLVPNFASQWSLRVGVQRKLKLSYSIVSIGSFGSRFGINPIVGDPLGLKGSSWGWSEEPPGKHVNAIFAPNFRNEVTLSDAWLMANKALTFDKNSIN